MAGPDFRAALGRWHAVLAEFIRRDDPDLSTRQMTILLHVYVTDGPHSVKGLSATLAISKPAVSRALDRLGDLGYIRRLRDMSDRRNVLVERTVKGSVYLSEFAELIAKASAEA